MSGFKVVSGSWVSLKQHAEYIRQLVFIDEQHINPNDEWDSQDANALHFVVYTQDQPIATARLLENNSIGRVAVLKPYRGNGIGRLLMLDIIAQAKIEGRASLKLSSQVHAVAFYESLGFSVVGSEYLDCDIAHIDMFLNM